MSEVMISSDGTFDAPSTCADMLTDAGFKVRFRKDRDFPIGTRPEDVTIEELRGVVGVLAWGERYSKKVIDALPDLRIIARVGVGFDSVDTEAATDRGVVVTITPNANHEAVAEHAMALLFAVAKHIVSCDQAMRRGEWPSADFAPVRRQTLGIGRLGRIGRSTAVRALGMRMKVVASDPYADREFAKEHGIELVELDELLGRSDYVTIHSPLSDATHGMMNAEKFSKMKKGSVFLNTARGGLVVENDLIDALNSGHLRAAGLDVFETEPTTADNPLFQMKNVVVSSHKAGNDYVSMEDMGIEAAQCVIDVGQGKWPEGAVINRDVKDRFKL